MRDPDVVITRQWPPAKADGSKFDDVQLWGVGAYFSEIPVWIEACGCTAGSLRSWLNPPIRLPNCAPQ